MSLVRIQLVGLLLCGLPGLAGCLSMQTGSLSPLVKEESRRTGRSAVQAEESLDRREESWPEPLVQEGGEGRCNAKDGGFCEACGTTHGQTRPAAFKFSRPVPDFQPLSAVPRASDDFDIDRILRQFPSDKSNPVTVVPEPIVAVQPERLPPSDGSSPTDTIRSEISQLLEIGAATSATGTHTTALVSPSAAANSSVLPESDALPTPAETVGVSADSQKPQSPPANLAGSGSMPERRAAAVPQPVDEEISPSGCANSDKTAGLDPQAPATDSEAARANADPSVAPAAYHAPIRSFTADHNSPPPQASEMKSDCGLKSALDKLRQTALSSLDPIAAEEWEAELEALQLLADRVETYLDRPAGSAPADSLFDHQLAALVTSLRPEALDVSRPEGRQTAAATLAHLREAAAQLEQRVSLKVIQGALCTAVRGFGQYDPLPSHELHSGQAVLLYCEIQNFQSQIDTDPTGGQEYRTRLKSSLVVCSESGSVVQQADFPAVEDVARNRRRDFYLYIPFTVGQLPPGTYRLHLLVDDLQGNKQASLEPAVEFRVR